MKRYVLGLGLAVAVCVGGFFVLTRPVHTDPAQFAAISADPVRGEQVFWAGGCASCHADAAAEGNARLILSGGRAFATDFGTFYAPNISPDPVSGIGGWSVADLDSAMRHGTSPDGRHYYPAFPYTSYVHASFQDVADLKAFLDTLPPSDRANTPHDLGFPFNQRWLMGGWKLINPSGGWVVAGELSSAEARGRYLVEGLGHCGECHTPRDFGGGTDKSQWLAGAVAAEGEGIVPNITPGALDWSEGDIAEYLKSGFTPDYDSVGGSMADVVTNLSHLPDSDRAAIAAYLKRVPALP